MGWIDGIDDGVSKISFNFFNTLGYQIICTQKIATNILTAFKIRCHVGGGDQKFHNAGR